MRLIVAIFNHESQTRRDFVCMSCLWREGDFILFYDGSIVFVVDSVRLFVYDEGERLGMISYRCFKLLL